MAEPLWSLARVVASLGDRAPTGTDAIFTWCTGSCPPSVARDDTFGGDALYGGFIGDVRSAVTVAYRDVGILLRLGDVFDT